MTADPQVGAPVDLFQNLTAPAADEIEVSIFGKGYGEAIAIHVGDGRWLAVDSVAHAAGSVTRLYLEHLGVNLATNVDVIVATHWHDDHVKGIADLFQVCAAAEFVYPQAMLDDEFVKFAAGFNAQASKRFSSGVEEFGKVLAIARARKKPQSRWPLRTSANGYVGYRKPAGHLSHGKIISLEALSPSHHDIAAFLARVSGIKPDPRVLQRAPTYGRNDVSSAFWLEIGGDAVLLAADVEAGLDVNSGWNAILGSSVRPAGKARLVKVPHHGGLSGHHDGMWSSLLTKKPTATLTPWSKGGNRLPSAADVRRISELAGAAFSTGPAATVKSPEQPTVVTKVLKKDNVTLRRLVETLGHVRHRAKVSATPLDWSTDLLGRACPLKAMAA